jgi:tRNA A-37 threonylcarbamoyl transferase component Bud32
MEPAARFCGVCGHRLDGPAPAGSAGSSPAKPKAAPVATLVAPGGGAGAAKNPRLAAAQAKAAAAASAVGPMGAPVGGAAAAVPAAPQVPKASPTDPTAPPRPSPMALAASGQSPKAVAAAVAARPKSPSEMYLGQVLNNRFRIESKIGEGGFGAVYRGVQLATGRKVALKLLHPEMTKDENLVARFRREGQVLCNLRDAHSITTYDFDQTADGTLYIAMELLEGKSLHTVFHNEAPIEWRRMVKILTEMCSSLAEAHAMGIVHRDLKPENIYLESRPGNPEFVKILDFGIAKVMRGDGSMDPQAPQLTATGQTLGTLEYMSPEQLMGKQLDGRSDVYALGVLAYELMTGQLPFPDAKGPAGLITAQLKQTPKAPSVVRPAGGIPAAVDALILRCLEKDKNNRFADVSAVAAASNEVLAAYAEASSPGIRMPAVGGAATTLPAPVAAPVVPAAAPVHVAPPGAAHIPPAVAPTMLAGQAPALAPAQVSGAVATASAGASTAWDESSAQMVPGGSSNRKWIILIIALIVVATVVGVIVGSMS